MQREFASLHMRRSRRNVKSRNVNTLLKRKSGMKSTPRGRLNKLKRGKLERRKSLRGKLPRKLLGMHYRLSKLRKMLMLLRRQRQQLKRPLKNRMIQLQPKRKRKRDNQRRRRVILNIK